jgi:hypothetical protein
MNNIHPPEKSLWFFRLKLRTRQLEASGALWAQLAAGLKDSLQGTAGAFNMNVRCVSLAMARTTRRMLPYSQTSGS